MTHDNYCLHCGLEKGRPGGCPTCGQEAQGREVENHPLCLPAGTLLNDQYRIGRVLGAGGFGITYLAIDIRLGLRVAIKEYMPRSDATRGTDRCTVQPATHVDEEPFRFGLGKFLEEARVLARISEKANPRIVTIHNFFETNGTAYLVMRYLEGQSLAQYLSEKGGRLAEQEAVYIATAMLDGLREVHAAGLVHRDIKPHNVFVTTDGGIILIDFGAARYAQGVKSKALTQVLTPPYAPFEQYFEKGQQGPWTDLYAVGATLYQMLTGKLPDEAPARVYEDTLVPPSQASGGKTSASLDDVLTKALSPQASDRFRTVEEFQAALLPTTSRDQTDKEQQTTKSQKDDDSDLREGAKEQQQDAKSRQHPDQQNDIQTPASGRKRLWRPRNVIIMVFGLIGLIGLGLGLGMLRGQTGMVTVPAGPFWQGCNESVDHDCEPFEKPYHEVNVPAFEIDKFEVTVDSYGDCVSSGGCTASTGTSVDCNQGKAGNDNHPMNCITWDQAREYCRWAGKRLCSESEWEKASRGTDGRKYPWGSEKATCEYAVMGYSGNGCGKDSTWPVGSKPAGASPYGALDMIGNVWEWVEDDWHDDYTDAPTNGDDWIDDPRASFRVARGGSFLNYDFAAFLRLASQSDAGFIGVRCCRSK